MIQPVPIDSHLLAERQLRYCVRVAEVFPEAEILHTLCSQLSWSHLRLVIQIEDPLKRDFYLEICRVERWSVHQVQERINSLLFERTAISKKPEEPIRQDLSLLRDQGQLLPDLTFRAPMCWTSWACPTAILKRP